jgi:Xaa-Pro aminopeptidase
MNPKSKTRQLSATDAKLIVAASETQADLLYATGFFAPDPFIFFIHRGRKYLVMSDLEIDRAKAQARVHSVLPLSRYEKMLRKAGVKSFETAPILAKVLNDRGIRSVIVPSSFPLGLAEQLRECGLRVHVSVGPIFPEREFKTSPETREIQKAQQGAEAGVAAAIQVLRDSTIRLDGTLWWNGAKLTSQVLKQQISIAVLGHGCVASRTIVACGEQGVDPHQEGSGLLKAHQPIIIDVFPRSQRSGYWGDITRTVVKGRASDRLKAQYQAVYGAQKLALEEIRPGISGRAVHQKVVDYFQRQGFVTGTIRGRMQGFFHGTGHGVGLEIHEAPRLSGKGDDCLRPGHVVTVEPGLYYAGIGGVRLEDLVVVTPTGIRNLTRFPKYLELR